MILRIEAIHQQDPMKKTAVFLLSLPDTNSDGKKGFLLLPGESVSFPFTPSRPAYPVRRRLRVVGESDVFWMWRCEPGSPFNHYQGIADSLESNLAPDELHCLHFQGAGESWPRAAYIRAWPHNIAGKKATFSIRARTKNISVAPGGEMVVELGIYLAKPGRAGGDVFDPPDMIHRLPVPRGTHTWTRLAQSISIPRNTDVLLVRLSGRRFTGEVWLGSPRLFMPGGDTVIPPLVPDNRLWPVMNWLGENLSKAEWPEFELLVNGKTVCRDAFFSPVVRAPDFDMPLPGLSGKCRLELKLLRSHPNALPFVIRRVEVYEESARPIEIVAFPEYVPENTTFPVLIERNSKAAWDLDVIPVQAGSACPAPEFSIDLADRREIIRPRRVVRHGDDRITLSTGDAVYVPQTRNDFLRYLAWYAANRIGNSVCFRPVYRWCGSREVNTEAWQAAIRLLNKLGMKYHLMVDCRELPGMNANPADRLLAGKNYLGRQAHEQDGAFYYWGANRSKDTLFSDIFFRGKDNGGILPAVRPPVRQGDASTAYFDALRVADMKAGADYFVSNLKLGKGISTRHTGPSTLFRYFFQAGYDWVGAEQMYSAEEIVLSAARGATRAYGRKEFGAHLAMQWSSSPHDTQAHADRYFLALATCYLQGAGNINTEEGLYRMESEYADHDRFSHACERHRQANTKFRRFMETHTRRGTIRVPLAVLQGRHCAWRCFGRGPAWNSARPEFAFGAPEESFDLLKIFFPRSVLDAIYRNPCTDDQPFGWYSGTPFGPVDLLPIEAPVEVLATYRAMAFLGWNTFHEPELRKLLAYVENGGTLLLARPHLSRDVRRQQPASLPNSKALGALLGQGWKSRHGRHTRRLGQGTVIYYGTDLYPCNKAIRKAYEKDLATLGTLAIQAEKPRGWIEANEDIAFTAFDWPDGKTRTIYLLNTDWWSKDRAHSAHLLLGPRRFKIPVRFGRIETITVCGDTAVWPDASDADILKIAPSSAGTFITLQSDIGTRIRAYSSRSAKPTVTSSAGSGVCTIRLP